MHGMDRDQQGRFEQTIPDSEFVTAVAENEPAATQEVADQLEIHRRSAQYRLDRLVETGRINKKKIGNSLAWSVRSGWRHEQAFEEFADRLTDEFDEEIHEIILYGSVARGEARGIDSDVDVLIVTKTEEDRETVYESAYDISTAVIAEYGVAISLNFKTINEVEEQRDYAYIRNVLNEGRVYG